MEGLASQAKPAHAVFPVGTTTKPLTCAQGHTFQAHSLQIILLGPFICEPNVVHGLLKIKPYNWRRLWEGFVSWHRR